MMMIWIKSNQIGPKCRNLISVLLHNRRQYPRYLDDDDDLDQIKSAQSAAFDICSTYTHKRRHQIPDDDEIWSKEEEYEDNIVLLEFKMCPRREAKSIYSTVSHPWPHPPSPSHIATHPPPSHIRTRTGRSAKRRPPLQKLLTAGNDWRKRPRSQNMICSVLLGSSTKLLLSELEETPKMLKHICSMYANIFCRRWQNHVRLLKGQLKELEAKSATKAGGGLF